MPTEPIEHRLDLAGICASLERNTQRLTSLLRDITTIDRRAIGQWTIHDVALHVTDGIENYARQLQGRDGSQLDFIRNMARWNIERVKGLPRQPVADLADRIGSATEEFLQVARSMDPTEEVPWWYAGSRLPAVVSVSLRLVEHILHGYDIATAAGHSWPIDDQDAVTMTYGLAYISSHFVDADKLNFDGIIEMRLGGGAPYFFVIEDRGLRVETHPPAPAGFHISAHPVAWVLVSTGRVSRIRAVLTGTIIGWGTRPLLPLKLQRASIQG